MRVKIAFLTALTAIATFFGVLSAEAQTVITTPASCHGECNGTAYVVGLCPADTVVAYNWSNGQTTSQATGLCPGQYFVIVNSLCVCDTFTFIIGQSGPWSVATSTPETCGNHTGTATLWVEDGVEPISYVWNTGATTLEITGLSAGNYTATATDANGCTTSGYTIVENNSSNIFINVAITSPTCNQPNGGLIVSASNGTAPYTYLWSNGQTTKNLSNLAAGTYTVTVTDANGCTTAKSVTLVNQGLPTMTNLSLEGCGSVSLLDETFYNDTTVTRYYIGQFSCDSTVTWNINITEIPTDTTKVVWCGTGSIDFQGQSFNSAGVFEVWEMVPNGCNRKHVLIVNTLPVSGTVVTEQYSCLTQSVFSYAAFTIDGCLYDSLVVTYLLPPNPPTVDTILVCDYSLVGTTTTVGIGANGCDVMNVKVSLPKTKASEVKVTKITCNPALVGTDLVKTNNCDPDTLVTTVYQPLGTQFVEFQTCLQGQTWWTTNETSGDCPFTLVHIPVYTPAKYEFKTEVTCDSFAVGITVDTTESFLGCDSLITTTTKVFSSILQTNLMQTICAGESFQFGSQFLTEQGMYSQTLTSVNGCDSLVILSLFVLPAKTGIESETICHGYQKLWHGNTYNVSGNYTITMENAASNGCDSLVTLCLTVLPPKDTVKQNLATCVLAEHGETSSVTMPDVNGCDSTTTTIKYWMPVFELNTTVAICHVRPDGLWYVRDTVQNSDGCWGISDTIFYHNPDFVSLFKPTCDPTLDGKLISKSWIPSTVSQDSCDRWEYLYWKYEAPKSFHESATICNGESFLFDGQNLTVSGQYFQLVPNQLGCNDTMELNLTVLPAIKSDTTIFVCPGSSWEAPDGMQIPIGSTWAETGISVTTGCDSIYTVNVKEFNYSSNFGVPGDLVLTAPNDTLFNFQVWIEGLTAGSTTGFEIPQGAAFTGDSLIWITTDSLVQEFYFSTPCEERVMQRNIKVVKPVIVKPDICEILITQPNLGDWVYITVTPKNSKKFENVTYFVYNSKGGLELSGPLNVGIQNKILIASLPKGQLFFLGLTATIDGNKDQVLHTLVNGELLPAVKKIVRQ